MRILYNSKDSSFKMPFGTLTEGQKCKIRIKIPASCKTVEAGLVLVRENLSEYAKYPMYKTEADGDYEAYEVVFSLSAPDLYFYYFRIKTENEEFSLYRQGYADTNMEEGEMWQLSCIPADFTVPCEYFGRVMYQIFPDRFNKFGECDTNGKIKPFWIHQSTKDIPSHLPAENGKVENCDFFGGNLNGITEKLDYLSELGVGIIYLNPIFKAWSNHRYDTADYMKIDELLGNEQDFTNLCREAHKRDIKIIIDGVFSHTGSKSIYFDRENTFGGGAYHDKNSPYFSWFNFERYPDVYDSWWGIDTLPCVDENAPSYRDYIIDGEDSVLAHWIRAGADGFRLDVADELPDEFIAAFRKRLKEINPHALLIGEVWEDASNKISYGKRRRYFTGAELDSVMNYPIKNAIIEYATGLDNGTVFAQSVMTVAENYPPSVVNCLMNMLSTHDTPRVLSVLSPDSPPESKSERAGYKMSNDALQIATMRLELASALQFVLPGMPSVFYGDELGTEGFEDPFCRSFFDWDRVNGNPLCDFFAKLSALRNSSEPLRRGDVSANSSGDGIVTAERRYNGRGVRIIANNGSARSIKALGRAAFTRRAEIKNSEYIIDNYGFVIEEI